MFDIHLYVHRRQGRESDRDDLYLVVDDTYHWYLLQAVAPTFHHDARRVRTQRWRHMAIRVKSPWLRRLEHVATCWGDRSLSVVEWADGRNDTTEYIRRYLALGPDIVLIK